MRDEAGFVAAVAQGDAMTVAAMLAKEPALAHPRSDGAVDPVALAAEGGHLAVLRLLLEHGGMSQAKTPPQASNALMQAARAGRAEAVALLLEHGADPGLRDREGRTAADHASARGHCDLAERLRLDTDMERVLR